MGIYTFSFSWRVKLTAAFIVIMALSVVANAEQVEMRIGGTGGALGTIKQLAARYCKDHPNVKVTVLPSLGSSGGIKAVLAGAIDIGLSARRLNDSEQAASARQYGMTPFVFVVQRQAAAAGVTSEEIIDIYNGKKAQWSDGSKIRVVMRPSSEYDFAMLQRISPRMEEAVSRASSRQGMIVEMTDQDNLDAIEKTPGAFGTTTLAQILSENRHVKILTLNGTQPSIDAVRDGRYPYVKTYYFVTKRLSSTGVQDFLTFVHSPAGSEILTRLGYLVPGP